MSKILMLQGLPASGKSTYAKELVNRGGWKRVNKDDLRAMLDNGKWSKGNERFVLVVRDLIVLEALNAQQSVVVDDTNFAPQHEAQLREFADQYKIPFEVKFFDTSVDECIRRDLIRPNSVGSKVIKQMYNQYLAPKAEHYTPPAGKPKCILVDIDGTLAHMAGRSPYDWSRVGEDTLDETIARLIDRHSDKYKIILLSGRKSEARDITLDWLKRHNIYYDDLFMRATGDDRKDDIVKRELFDAHIRDNYQVEFVLDDRDRVVAMWRGLGLKVLQVAEGDF